MIVVAGWSWDPQVLDEDGSGVVDATELRHALGKLGLRMADADAMEIITQLGGGGDSGVALPAFQEQLHRHFRSNRRRLSVTDADINLEFLRQEHEAVSQIRSVYRTQVDRRAAGQRAPPRFINRPPRKIARDLSDFSLCVVTCLPVCVHSG